MWDNPKALNIASAVLFSVSALVIAGAGVFALVRSPAFPLRSIQVLGDLEHVTQSQVIAALQGRVSGTFFTVDLDEMRRSFEAIPWVRHAEVRRHWPARLQVRVHEHRALARWLRAEERRLVNMHGEVFVASTDADLPTFAGPAGSEREVTRRYAEFVRALEPLGVAPRHVALSDRLAWQIRLDNGMVLLLGRDAARDPVSERLARFVQAYPSALARLENAGARGGVRFDLRYPNGFALRVREAEQGVNRSTRPRA
jgi:cell division protein FtsQ